MFEKDEKLSLDWELDRIANELEKMPKLDQGQRRLATLKMLKALMLDVQEGRVESIMLGIAGRSNGEHTKHFVFVQSDSGSISGMDMLNKLLNKTVIEHLKGEVVRMLRDFLEGN